MVLTDMVSHASYSGQHALVYTGIVPLDDCRLPGKSPVQHSQIRSLEGRSVALPLRVGSSELYQQPFGGFRVRRIPRCVRMPVI